MQVHEHRRETMMSSIPIMTSNGLLLANDAIVARALRP